MQKMCRKLPTLAFLVFFLPQLGVWGTEVWGTYTMGYKGMGHIGNGVQEQWGK